MKKVGIFTLIFLLFFMVVNIKIKCFAIDDFVYGIGGEILCRKNVKESGYFNRYFIYEFKNGGYLIYDNDFNMIVEYSLVCDSPYKNKTEDLFYFGPTNYIYKDDNLYKNYLNQVVDINDFTSVSVNKNYSKQRSVEFGEVPYSFYFKNLDGIVNQFPENISGMWLYTIYLQLEI